MVCFSEAPPLLSCEKDLIRQRPGEAVAEPQEVASPRGGSFANGPQFIRRSISPPGFRTGNFSIGFEYNPKP